MMTIICRENIVLGFEEIIENIQLHTKVPKDLGKYKINGIHQLIHLRLYKHFCAYLNSKYPNTC